MYEQQFISILTMINLFLHCCFDIICIMNNIGESYKNSLPMSVAINPGISTPLLLKALSDLHFMSMLPLVDCSKVEANQKG